MSSAVDFKQKITTDFKKIKQELGVSALKKLSHKITKIKPKLKPGDNVIFGLLKTSTSFAEVLNEVIDKFAHLSKEPKRVVIDIGRQLVGAESSVTAIVSFIENMPSEVYKYILPLGKRIGGINEWKKRSEELVRKTQELSKTGQIKQIEELIHKFIWKFNVTILYKEYTFLQTGKPLDPGYKGDTVSVQERLDYLLLVRNWRSMWCSLYYTLCPIDANLFLELSSTFYTIGVLSSYQFKNEPMIIYVIEKGKYAGKSREDIPTHMRFDLFMERSKQLRMFYTESAKSKQLTERINSLSKRNVEHEYQETLQEESKIRDQLDALWFFQSQERERLDAELESVFTKLRNLKEMMALEANEKSDSKLVTLRQELQKEQYLNQMFNTRWVTSVKQFVNDFRHFVKDFFPFISITAKETFKPSGGILGWIKGAGFSEAELEFINNMTSDVLIHQIFLCQNVRDELPKWYCTTGVGAKTTKEDVRSLNKLWESKCGPKKSWGTEALFCRAGAGDVVPMLLMSIYFTPVQGSPKNHLLYSAFSMIEDGKLTDNKKVNALIRNIVKRVITAYDKVLQAGGQYMSIKDLDAVAKGYLMLRKFNRFIKELGYIYGLSVGPDPAFKKLLQSTKPSKRVVDLDAFAKKHCEYDENRAPSDWYHSVLCYMARMSPLAYVIGQLQFTVPEKADQHALKQVLEVVQKAIEKNPTFKKIDVAQKQFMKKVLWKKKIKVSDIVTKLPVIKTIYEKIDKEQPLTWTDIDHVYQTILKLPQIGERFVSWKSLNENLGPIGIKFAELEELLKHKSA